MLPVMNVTSICQHSKSFFVFILSELKKGSTPCPPAQKINPPTTQRQKKSRTVFTKRQILKLESMFYAKRYLSNTDRIELSKSLALSESQVRKTVLQLRGCQFVMSLLHSEDFFICRKNTKQQIGIQKLIHARVISFIFLFFFYDVSVVKIFQRWM